MAFKLPTDQYQNAVIANNHFDTDGVLSVFACLEPCQASRYAKLCQEGAEAGDFGEWSSDAGIKLDATLEGICAQDCGGNDEQAFEQCLSELPALLQDIEEHGGVKYQKYWESAIEHAQASYDAIQSGRATLTPVDSVPRLVVSREPFALSSPALHRALVEQGMWESTHRILRVIGAPGDDDTGRTTIQFWYEKPGHAWVQKLRDRHVVLSPDDKKMIDILGGLQEATVETEAVWKKGGRSLVSLCESGSIAVSSEVSKNALVDRVLDALIESEKE
mmetsp:Transcript_21438/g.44715  ORF Transcript_21438/g.44715 Transcript_21438/m.44715 type:complete len:276 (+) Transcript_21438:336-1163(+)